MKRRDMLKGAAVAAGVAVAGISAPVGAKAEPCCERDHDGDGNCDRHPRTPWLSCFQVDNIPTTLPANRQAVYDKVKGAPAWVLGEEGDNIYQVTFPEHVAVPRVRCSDAVLESAAGELLLCAAGHTKSDHWHLTTARDKPRTIEGPNGVRLSVGDPDFVGYLLQYPDGTRGLVLHNSHAVVKL